MYYDFKCPLYLKKFKCARLCPNNNRFFKIFQVNVCHQVLLRNIKHPSGKISPGCNKLIARTPTELDKLNSSPDKPNGPTSSKLNSITIRKS